MLENLVRRVPGLEITLWPPEWCSCVCFLKREETKLLRIPSISLKVGFNSVALMCNQRTLKTATALYSQEDLAKNIINQT